MTSAKNNSTAKLGRVFDLLSQRDPTLNSTLYEETEFAGLLRDLYAALRGCTDACDEYAHANDCTSDSARLDAFDNCCSAVGMPAPGERLFRWQIEMPGPTSRRPNVRDAIDTMLHGRSAPALSEGEPTPATDVPDLSTPVPIEGTGIFASASCPHCGISVPHKQGYCEEINQAIDNYGQYRVAAALVFRGSDQKTYLAALELEREALLGLRRTISHLAPRPVEPTGLEELFRVQKKEIERLRRFETYVCQVIAMGNQADLTVEGLPQ